MHSLNFSLYFIIIGLLLWLSWLRIQLQFGRPWFDPWVEKIPWRREQLPVFLENSMDCIVHGVAKNQTRLSDFHFTSSLLTVLKILLLSGYINQPIAEARAAIN